MTYDAREPIHPGGLEWAFKAGEFLSHEAAEREANNYPDCRIEFEQRPGGVTVLWVWD